MKKFTLSMAGMLATASAFIVHRFLSIAVVAVIAAASLIEHCRGVAFRAPVCAQSRQER